ncbi:universal stress protein [Micromonospora sp. CA-244673]|uniref:universal stress protein n=1 Tax=Micromonospora sp. CA-244673 TaxID=3239958 RepID=UPI003D8F63AD
MPAPTHGAVVVGVGSSAEDLQLVRTAAGEAAAHDRPLHLLHAFNWAAALESFSVSGPRDAAEELLEQAGRVATEVAPGMPVTDEIVEGDPVEALIRASDSAFLLAVGDSGMSGRPGCAPADVPSVQVAARAGCPVLVARIGPPPQGPLLVGFDGSASSRATLAYAFDCAEGRATRLLAIRVTEPNHHTDGDDGLLDEAVARCGARYPRVAVECHTISGDPGAVLVEQSRSAQVALVGARGDEPLRGMLGAVSQTLLYHSPAPVIVVRGLDPDDEDGS